MTHMSRGRGDRGGLKSLPNHPTDHHRSERQHRLRSGKLNFILDNLTIVNATKIIMSIPDRNADLDAIDTRCNIC